MLVPLCGLRYGEKGDTGKVPLKKSQNKDKFKRGATDNFTISAADIGAPIKLTIGHDNSREKMGLLTDPSWYLDHVVVDVPSLGTSVTFPNPDGWLDKKRGKGTLEVTLLPGAGGEHDAVNEYAAKKKWEVVVFTSDVKNAGTDADVTVDVSFRDGEGGSHTVCTLHLLLRASTLCSRA